MAPRAKKPGKVPDLEKQRLKAERERRRQEAFDEFLRGKDGRIDQEKVAKVLRIINDGAEAAMRDEILNAKAIVGRWRISKMPDFDRETIDLDVPAFIEFTSGGRGSFQFILVRGEVRAEFSKRKGFPRVAFTFEGHDEGDEVHGRGEASIQPDGTMAGRFFIHQGDDHAFVAERMDAKPTKKSRLR